MPTKIEWADETLSPIRARLGDKVGWACEKVSRGCENCYAQAINRRRGTRLPYTVGAMAQVEPYLDEAVLRRVLHWRKPRRIFWESMSDLFGWWVTDAMLVECYAAMVATPWHTHLVLTKRPERRRALFADQEWRDLVEYKVCEIAGEMPARYLGQVGPSLRAWRGGAPQNIFEGTSIENQATADLRVPELLLTQAARRFLSVEPLLEPVDLSPWMWALDPPPDAGYPTHKGPDLVIVGGESGPGARPCRWEWIRSIKEQCEAAGVSFFCKQAGSVLAREYNRLVRDWAADGWWEAQDLKGGRIECFPEDLRVRQWPEVARG